MKEDHQNNSSESTHDELEFQRILHNYEQYLQFYPDSAETYYNLAMVYAQFHHPDKAIQSYHKAIELKPDLVQAYLNVAGIYLQKGDTKECIAQIQKAIEIQPDFDPGLLRRLITTLRSLP